MKKQGLAVLLLMLGSSAALAAGSAEDERMQQELLAVIDEETSVATRSKVNSDYVPGMVTVLNGQDLQAQGVRNVWEALAQVPGMLSYRGGPGDPFVSVRGLVFPFNAGNIQVQVNSVALSREYSGASSSLLLLPIEQVDRIEVVRGPGSALYGEFAFMGLVNIITRESGNGVFAAANDHEGRVAGGRFRGQAGELTLAGNVSVLHEDDALASYPQEATDRMDFGVFDLKYRGSGLKLHVLDREYDRQVQGGNKGETHYAVDATQHLQLQDRLGLDLKLGYLDNQSVTGMQTFLGSQWSFRADLDWQASAKQRLLVSASTQFTHVDTARQVRAAPPPPPGPPPPGPPPPPPPVQFLQDFSWSGQNLTLQDQLQLTDAVSVTAGLSFDQRDDIERNRITPRLGAVWVMNESHLLKAQYAEGFRGPTFFEADGAWRMGNNLDYEVNATTEASYIYRDSRRVGRVTVFQTRLTDMIFDNGPAVGFLNAGTADSDGVELEWEQKLGDSWKWMSNVSYADSSDTRNAALVSTPVFASAEWLGNAGLSYAPVHNVLLNLQGYYVGRRYTGTGSGYQPDYVTGDFTASFINVWPQWTFRAGVKNFADAEQMHVFGGRNGASVRDYTRRLGWLQASYEF
jgi:iron complex outermembrane receptor protein